MRFGEVKLLPLGEEESASLRAEPGRRFDLGSGPGKTVEREVRGGAVGLILDARGRPLGIAGDRAACRAAVTRWVEALRLYAPL